MKKILNYSLAIIVFLSALLSGCTTAGPKKGNTPGTSQTSNQPANPAARKGSITTGAKVEIVSQPIAASGGMISVSKPGDPLDGFVLDVPAKAYTTTSNFKVSYAPITNQTFGSNINPITPMITIDNGGVKSTELLYVRIPAKIPADQFAMAFIYDAKTKQLEGVPMVAADADSVTITTTHFCDLFLSMISKVLLKTEIDSGFKAGIDDWQFPNFGSYIAPGGHCAGQAISAMWYYCTKPDGGDAHLFGRYDNNGDKPATPDMWQDDSSGYRFASVIQSISWDDKALDFWRNIQGKQEIFDNNDHKWKLVDVPLGLSDEMTRDLFAYSMQATGEPQYVNIRSNSGGGHVMVVYKIKDGQLFVADPNYPGNTERRIEISNGKFIPYNSGATTDDIANGKGKAYEKIMYYAKTTIISWDTIASYWAQLKNKTIGDGTFPAYQLLYYNDNGQVVPLTDGTLTPFDGISILVPGFTKYIYRDGEKLTPDAKGNIDLKPGDNKLGIAIYGKVDTAWEYIDFQYIHVNYGGLVIDPLTLDGEINKEYTFTVKADNPPANARYSWVVDNAILQTDAQKTFKTTFKSTGKHTVVAKLLDAAGKELEKAQSTATIKDAVKLTVTPDVLKGEIGKEYTFTASLANPPAGIITYEWSVNGNVKKSAAEASFQNTFTAEGPFTVTLRALLAGKEIAKFDSNGTITQVTPTSSNSTPANNLAIIQKYSYMEATVYTNSIVHEYDKYNKPTDVDKQANFSFGTLYTPITWDGVKFSGTRTDTATIGSTVTETLSGTVSPDGNTLLTLTSKLLIDNSTDHQLVTIVLQNIPLSYINGTLNDVGLTSANVQKYVVSLENNLTSVDKGATYRTYNYKSPMWDNNSNLTVTFRKTATR